MEEHRHQAEGGGPDIVSRLSLGSAVLRICHFVKELLSLAASVVCAFPISAPNPIQSVAVLVGKSFVFNKTPIKYSLFVRTPPPPPPFIPIHPHLITTD